MSDGAASNGQPVATTPPTRDDVLRWCAEAAPEMWFPSEFAARRGIPRDDLDEPLWALRQAGLVHVVDWVRGKGQGYAVTPTGQQVLEEPEALPPEGEPPPEPEPEEPPPRPQSGLTAYDRGELTREAFLAPRTALVTPTLIVAQSAWFVAGLAAAWRMGVPIPQYLRDGGGSVLLRLGAADGAGLMAGEWWRLATSGFTHPGFLPLAVNLFALAVVGPVAEGLWGRVRFAGMYLMAALASALIAVGLHPTDVVSGASGAVGGVILAVIAWLIRYRDHLPPAVVADWARRLGLLAALSIVVALGPGMNWEGRLAGGLVGILTGGFFDLTRAGSGRVRLTVGTVGITVMIAVVAVAFLMARAQVPDWQSLPR